MRADIHFVKNKIREFNEKFFDSQLPELPVRLNDAGRALGMFVHPKRYPDSALRGKGECWIEISTRYDMPENEVEDIILHEMIHYFLWYGRATESSPHGPMFYSLMNAFNMIYKRHITVRHEHTEESLASDGKLKNHYLCITYWEDGNRYITDCTRARIFEINELFSKSPRVKKVEWYWSSDPFFNRYPASRTAKAYGIEQEDFEKYVLTATPCEIDAHGFHPKK